MAKKKSGSKYETSYHKYENGDRSSSFRAKESYKMLRTNIRFLMVGENHPRLVFTSGISGEGKSTTIINTAISLREAGYRVILIDCDLRCPVLHKMANLQIVPGLTNLLSGTASVDEVIRPTRYAGLDMVTSGAIPPNPTELLGSKAMADFLDEISERYDYILFDTPPINVVSDALVLSSLVTGYFFLVRENVTDKKELLKSIEAIRLVNAKLLGIVMNDVKEEKQRRRGKYYSKYRYGRYYRRPMDAQEQQAQQQAQQQQSSEQ